MFIIACFVLDHMLAHIFMFLSPWHITSRDRAFRLAPFIPAPFQTATKGPATSPEIAQAPPHPFCPGPLGPFCPGLIYKPGLKGSAARCGHVPPFSPGLYLKPGQKGPNGSVPDAALEVDRVAARLESLIVAGD
jgi:hypothetical protein